MLDDLVFQSVAGTQGVTGVALKDAADAVPGRLAAD
jgi:hypothetical protein